MIAPTRGTAGSIALLTLLVVATVLVVLFASPRPAPPDGDPGASDRVAPSATPGASGPVGGSASPSARGSAPATLAPSPTPATAPVLVGAGDIADCDAEWDTDTAALLDDIDGTVFTAGDNAYDSGTAAEFAACYEPTWGRHRDRTRPTPGNHDWRTGTLAAYFDYYGDAARGPEGSSWYSFDLGTWHVIMLDSECREAGGCGADSPQGRWLAADLAASTATCTVAIWHKPRFSSGDHGNDRAVAPFWTALYDAGTDVVINGHDHDYERFAPQDPDANEDRERGIRQFVAGTGGKSLRAFADTKPNSELRYAVTHGVFKMTLHDGSYDWEFIPTTGDFSDRGTAFCH